MISIILPSFNRAGFISATIESCLDQTYADFELIIVDDCSTDDSIQLIKSYQEKDPRIKLIQNSNNKKLPATLNIGFEAASGDYYTWISDDNMFSPRALEEMIVVLDDHPEIGLVYTDYTTIDNEGKKIARIYQEEPEYLPIRDCVGACFLYRASVAQQVGGYNEKLFLIEDYEYFLRMGLKTKFFHLSKSLYYYRVHKASLTQSRKEEIRLAKLRLKEQFVSKYNIPTKLKPIDELYTWFINEKSIVGYLKLISIILRNPIITSSYIIKNLVRLKIGN